MLRSSKNLPFAVLADVADAPCVRLFRENEQALLESEERFRVAFQTSPDAFAINDAHDGTYVAVNEGFTRLTGWTEPEIVGRSALNLGTWVDPADLTAMLEALREHGFVSNLEVRFRMKDGRVIVALMSARIATLRGRRFIISATRDVTEWKKAEEERDRLEASLHQASKMEAIGQLAGGVAHDFNNLLTVILSGVDVLKQGGVTPDLHAEIVQEISAAAERARDLTSQLLACARRQVMAPRPTDLGAVVRSSEKLLQRVLGEDVELVTEAAPSLWSVRCDPAQIEQVILNLAVNARDAMPDGGQLRIGAANVEVGEPLASQHPWLRPGEYVRISVRDTGCGMSPEVKARIFEPFFTTKPVGRGTGLGLAIVYGLVKQSDGFVLVDSRVGEGTVFDLYFPRIQEAVAPGAPEAAPVVAARGNETILVVEDDPHVLDVTVRSLRAGGYRVLTAASGVEALELVERERPALHLLVTDVVLPGLHGGTVADGIRRACPDVRVLFVSGYAPQALAERGVPGRGLELLHKPFTASSLLARVRSVLDAA